MLEKLRNLISTILLEIIISTLMKQFLILLVAISLSLQIEGQNKYFVQFKDKCNNQYALSSPEQFLSARALDRRIAQGIEIDSLDLPVSSTYVQGVADLGCEVHYTTKWLNGVVVSASSAEMAQVAALSYVVDTKQIYNPSMSKESGEKDSNIDRNSGYTFNYGNSAQQIEMLNGHMLHQQGFTGEGYQIAVIDAGFLNVDIHPAFDSLWANNQILGTRDFVDPTSNIFEEHYHGAAVLSTIGGNMAGQLVGTAPHASFWLIRTENSSLEQIIEEYNWVAGAEFADSVGVDVINTSLGYYTFDDASQDHTYADMNGINTPITVGANTAALRGIAVVVSAGNEGYSSWYYISCPADSPYVLTVGAVDSDGDVTYFSSHGPTYDNRVKPDVCAMGQSSVIAEGSSSISTGSGTSFSAPIVAGLVACLWQAHPDLKVEQLLQLIRCHASSYNDPNEDIGYGIANFFFKYTSSPSEEQKSMLIYPNPAHQVVHFNIDVENEVGAKAEIRSIDGRLVDVQNVDVVDGAATIQLPRNMTRGMYFFKVEIGQRTFTAKLIKV